MNRLGLDPSEAAAMADEGRFDGLAIELVMSHFTASEVPEDHANAAQIATFTNTVKPLFQKYETAFSLLNSSGHFLDAAPAFDLTRPGYALYGGNPTPGHANPMRAAVRLVARILQARRVPAGARVGYNGAWRAPNPRILATISAGYADGYPRGGGGTDARGPGGHTLVADRLCPIVGTISMDLIIVDVTEVPEAARRRGAPAVLIGDGIDLEQVGHGAKTIGYEILTNLGRRYRRQYQRA
jgi:alanine racemase